MSDQRSALYCARRLLAGGLHDLPSEVLANLSQAVDRAHDDALDRERLARAVADADALLSQLCVLGGPAPHVFPLTWKSGNRIAKRHAVASVWKNEADASLDLEFCCGRTEYDVTPTTIHRQAALRNGPTCRRCLTKMADQIGLRR